MRSSSCLLQKWSAASWLLKRFCQVSCQRHRATRQDQNCSSRFHDVEREAGAAGRVGDDLGVTAARAEEVAEFTVFAAEAPGGDVALEAAHILDPTFEVMMVLLEPVVQVYPVLAEHRVGGLRVEVSDADARAPAEIRRVVAETEAALGPIDILVNNAGPWRR